ncbi:hypothetical protein [Prosthecobacter sp.]|uniref:hypothetical protein n=1 Tax=Prosthecobacter sp. TaxID=1965333 RepID=UPI0037842B6E
MTDDAQPPPPAAAPSAAVSEAAAVFENLSEADASAVLESLHSESGGGDADAGRDAEMGYADEAGVEVLPGMDSLVEVLGDADLTGMTDAQMADFESGDAERVAAALMAMHSQHAEAGEFEGEPGTDAGADEGAAFMGGPARVSIKALKPEDRARTVQALDMIRAGCTPAEAFAEVFGITGGAAEDEGMYVEEGEDDYYGEPEAPELEMMSASAAPQVAELEQQLTALQQQYRTAKHTYDPAATDLLEQMTDVKLDLREARREAEAVNREWLGAQEESLARTTEMYGELMADEESGFVPCCEDEILLAEAKHDPILNYPDWPEKIGRRVIDKFFNGHAAQSPGHARGWSQIPPAPRHAVRLPGSPVGPGFSAGALSPQTAMAEIEKLTPEQQDAFIQSLDKLTAVKVRHRRPGADHGY